jgi:hypothetical protein
LPEHEKAKCPKCGKTGMEPGKVFAVGLRFNPQNARQFYTMPVSIAGQCCVHCGFLETYVSVQQLKAALRTTEEATETADPASGADDLQKKIASLEEENRRLRGGQTTGAPKGA